MNDCLKVQGQLRKLCNLDFYRWFLAKIQPFKTKKLGFISLRNETQICLKVSFYLGLSNAHIAEKQR